MQLKEMMEEICSRWNLPQNYIKFLNEHADNVYINMNDNKEEEDDFFSYENEIELYLSLIHISEPTRH